MAPRKQPDEEMLLALLDTQLRKCKALRPAFVVFDDAQEGSERRTFEFLYSAARQEIVRQQRGARRDRLFKPSAKATPAALRKKAPKFLHSRTPPPPDPRLLL